jgi:hypothetical protein
LKSLPEAPYVALELKEPRKSTVLFHRYSPKENMLVKPFVLHDIQNTIQFKLQ